MKKLEKEFTFQAAILEIIKNTDTVMVNVDTGDCYYLAEGRDGYLYHLNKCGEWQFKSEDEIFSLSDVLSRWYIKDKAFLNI